MADTISYSNTTVTSWMDSIATNLSGVVLQAAGNNTLSTKIVSAYTGSNITLNNVLGLYVGSRVTFTVLSGTKPTELDTTATYQVKTKVGSVITVCDAHDINAPALFLSPSVVSLSVSETPLTIAHPKDAWDYYRVQLRQGTANVNTVPLTVTRGWVGTQQSVVLTSASFTRSSTTTSPVTVNHWALIKNNIVVGAIALNPTISLAGTATVTFSHSILSQAVYI